MFHNRVKQWIGFFGLVVCLMNVGPVFSQEDPVKMLNGVTHRVITELSTHRDEIRKNRNKIYTLAQNLILPYVDFVEMSRWVVGRNAWNVAGAEMQQEFVKQFKNVVVNSYAGALLGYTDQQIEFLPLRGSVDQQRIQVSSLIKEKGKAPLHLDYRLIQSGNSWKVYDILIEGVSLAQGYRAQLADAVRQGGVPAAIQAMKNRSSSNSGR